MTAIIEPKPRKAPLHSDAEPEPTPQQIAACVMNPIPMDVLQELRSGHERFLSGFSRHPHSSRERMLEVEGAQHPIAAVLGCADSRVPVELLFDTGFGDLFVVRNAGTMSTTAAIASLE
jgi:carbonic anhydrase